MKAGCILLLLDVLSACSLTSTDVNILLFSPPPPVLNFYFSLIAGSDVCVGFYFDLLPTCA